MSGRFRGYALAVQSKIPQEVQAIKCVVVGDGSVGKTSLLISYTQNRFHTEYVPTIFDNYTADVNIDGALHKLGLFDTAGEEDYDKLRPMSYPRTDVFVACFAVDSRDSFANIKLKWIPELRHHCPHTPIILVCTKADLRISKTDAKGDLVSSMDGEELRAKTKLAYFIECSALTRAGVKTVFDQAIVAALARKHRKKTARCVLQ